MTLPEKEQFVENIIRGEIYCTAPSELIEALQDDSDFIEMHLISDAESDDDERADSEGYVEIFEYYLVSTWLARKLREIGEPTMEISTCSIWGRTCSGQAISYDGTFQKIYDLIQENS